jgi:agmatinase
MDPSVAPGSEGQEPGGLEYRQMRTMLRGIVEKGKLVGMG